MCGTTDDGDDDAYLDCTFTPYLYLEYLVTMHIVFSCHPPHIPLAAVSRLPCIIGLSFRTWTIIEPLMLE